MCVCAKEKEKEKDRQEGKTALQTQLLYNCMTTTSSSTIELVVLVGSSFLKRF